jgi:3-oxoacyl-ACP reductase-like protein
MSIFGTILNKIFHHGDTQAAAPAPQPAAPAPAAVAPAQPASPAIAPVPAAPAQPVDVGAVLAKIAADKGQPSDWHHSIVDLLKLLDMDSSLSARKELAEELNIHAGADGSGEQNLALHRAVMKKLAENGGKLPADLVA